MPLIMVGMLTLFLTHDSFKERFVEARELFIRMSPGCRRPGKTAEGFWKAFGRLRRRVLQSMQPILRDRVSELLQPVWYFRGWIPIGVDGSRLTLPEFDKLTRRFRTASGTQSRRPHMWITALVHLGTGVNWAWRLGRADASERHHMLDLIETLPEDSLLVADAGFTGYELFCALMKANRHFLIRLSGSYTLFVDYELVVNYKESKVYIWPRKNGGKKRKKPLVLRLIRLAGKTQDNGAKNDVWLITNVLDSKRLSCQTAGIIFRMRWEHEVFYRTYKCTLNQAKLASRTVRHAIREVELLLMSTQLFLAQSAWATQVIGGAQRATAAGAASFIRRELRMLHQDRLRQGYLYRLAEATREHRPNRNPRKESRASTANAKKHKPPGPPEIKTLTNEQKAELHKQLRAA